jgi:hypothetical protein
MTSIPVLVLIVSLLLDSLFSDASSIFNQALPENSRVVLFSIIFGIAFVSGSHVVLHDVKKIKSELGSKNNILYRISRIMPFVQYNIIGLLITVVLQIIFTSQYYTVFLVASLVLSWSTGVMIMGIMSFKFIQWYRAKKNYLVLLYFISSLMFCVTLGSTIIPQNLITLQTFPVLVNSHSTEVKPFQANPQDLTFLFAIISIANWFVIPLVFILWAATALMLNHYSKKIGRTKYWVMLSAPLASFVVGTTSWLFFLPSLSSIFDEKVILYTMMAFGGILAEGFLLAFAFITISRSVQKGTGNKINDYLAISAKGIAILFVSFFANPSIGSYLPFGVLSSSFFGFGAYLFFSGIYSSASSISSDSTLRQSIRKSLLDQSKLLDNIGLADINRQMDTIIRKHKETMIHETGIESPVSEVEMKNYVQEIIVELKKGKEKETV